MFDFSVRRKIVGSAVAALFVVPVVTGGFSASAQQLPQSAKSQTGKQIKLRSNKCAVYGPGFKPVGDGGTCIKVGGAVRFEMMVRPGSNSFRTR